MTSNEARQIIGMKPADDPNADTLLNPNVDTIDQGVQGEQKPENNKLNEGEDQNVEET
jgi:hypothetical protein